MIATDSASLDKRQQARLRMERQEEEQRQLKKAQRDVFAALDKYDSVRQSASATVGEKIARMIELGESKKSAAELTGISSRDVSAFLADFEDSQRPAGGASSESVPPSETTGSVL